MIGLWKQAIARLRGRVSPRTGTGTPARSGTRARPAPAAKPAATAPAAPPAAAAKPAAPPAAAKPAAAAPAAPPAARRKRPVPSGGRHLVYAPQLDGQADPGEIVWTWVPYEDDPRRGKDRPVLVIGRRGSTLLGLMLSSQHERDGQRHWFALGPGAWDRAARPSWIRLDRVLEVDEDGIRREGAVLDRSRFDAVARALRTGYGWH